MSDYNDASGVKGSVENESYCMPSWNKRNVEDMNTKMGFHNMSDRANSSTPPTRMTAAKSNPQLSPRMPGDNQYNYDKMRK